MNPFALGAKKRVKSNLDYHADNFASATPTPTSVPIPSVYTYMQNQEPCCGADMSTQILNNLYGFTGSPEFFWKNVRKIDGYPPEDGSSSDTLATVAKNVATCDLSLMPDNSTLSNADYAAYIGITQEMVDNASARKIGNYAFIDNPTMQQIKDNIFDHKVVGLRVDCGDGWWINGWSEAQTCPLKLGNYVDGHFITGIAFDENYVYFSNSWSVSWARNGIGYFDESYIPHVKELIIFIPTVTPVTPTPAQYQFLTNFGFGSNNADTHQLQIRLGMPKEYCTGYFGPRTALAVMLYQLENGIPPTSFVGPITRKKLNGS